MRADGKRTSVVEGVDVDQDGTVDADETSQVDWTYDKLGRVITEAFDHYDDLLDQTLNFSYDLNGNRLTQEKDQGSDGSIEQTTAYLYDQNDRLTTESLDSTNNTEDKTTTYTYAGTQQFGKTVVDGLGVAQQSITNTYDLQGRMASVTTTTKFDTDGITPTRIETVSYDYDTSGYRVASKQEIDSDADGSIDETKTTTYLADSHNKTGYTQTIQETETNSTETKTIDYTFGHDEISQTVTIADTGGTITSTETGYFLHDGHGSVRVLLDSVAAIMELYAFDAYGNAIGFDPATAKTNLGYSGETFDARIGQQYLRARYYNPSNGRFNRLDPFAGNSQDPQSFHKYLYTHGDSINGIDPTGMMNLTFSGVVSAIGSGLRAISSSASLKVLTTRAYASICCCKLLLDSIFLQL